MGDPQNAWFVMQTPFLKPSKMENDSGHPHDHGTPPSHGHRFSWMSIHCVQGGAPGRNRVQLVVYKSNFTMVFVGDISN